MGYVITLLLGVVAGAICTFLYMMDRHARMKQQAQMLESEAKRARASMAETEDQRNALRERAAELQKWASSQEVEFQRRTDELGRLSAEFNARHVNYDDLHRENGILKRDLQNIDVNLHKLELDGEMRDKKQQELDGRSRQLAQRYLDETIRWIGQSLTASNFAACKERLLRVIGWCRDVGFDVPKEQEVRLISDLKTEFEMAVRAAFEREEQARIKTQIREEEKVRREIEREIAQSEREKAAIQAALDRALAETEGRHTEEVGRLRARLSEAESKAQRALSMAQQTKAGHVYVISNIGSFGEGVFKVGMTRRLKPEERVHELGDASVPFPFDVHMMIHCQDAPSLENALHRALHKLRLNKVNPRKEFFRASLDMILNVVKQNHGDVAYIADPEALDYRQSLKMPEEDSEFIEQVFDSVEDESETVADDA